MTSNPASAPIADLLVVDDTPDNLRLLSTMLSEHGYKVRKVISGKLALRVVSVAPPDLILLDINMPQIDGYQVCQALKADPKTSDIPIVFLSALDDISDKVKAFALGGVDYITKPFQSEEVLARIKNQLTLRALQKQLHERNTRLQEEIAERQRTEAALRASEERWQLVLEGNNDGIWDWNIKTGETFYSTRYTAMLGYAEGEFGDRYEAWVSHTHPDDLDGIMASLEDYLRRNVPHYAIEYRLRCKDGSYKWVLSRGQAVWDEEGNPVRMVGSTRDITPRKLAEERLRRSEASLTAAQRVAHVGNWEYDVLTHQITWSEELFRIFGLDPQGTEPTYTRYFRLVHPDDRARLRHTVDHTIATGQALELDYRIVRPDGSICYVAGRGEAIVDERGQVVRLIGTALDITERKQTEQALRESEAREREKATQLEGTLDTLKRTQARLIQAEKMSSLGQVLAGVAHEINNPVGFIYGNLFHANDYFRDLLRLLQCYQQIYPDAASEIQQIQEEIDLDFLVDDWQQLMDSMQAGAERIHQMVRSLKLFARLDESEIKRVDLHQGIDTTLAILQHRLRGENNWSAIEVVKAYGQLPQVTCYASQMNQVFMNLLNNAIDALEGQPPPRTITIRTALEMRTRDIAPTDSPVAVIRIADNGPGMSEQLCQQIFDPFFTTKPIGRGTGLGLSISYQIIVEKHGGQLYCNSAPGKGTELVVEIPLNPILNGKHCSPSDI
jgi:PAS domain S-box-containing protein